MSQQSVIYLPPGVAAPAPQAPAVPAFGGPPFSKEFFEQVLPASIQSFCQQIKCEAPIVELLTTDGSRHYVRGISGVADQWVALHTQEEDHDHPVQVFLAYQTIFRVEIHPEKDDHQRRLGFIPAVQDK